MTETFNYRLVPNPARAENRLHAHCTRSTRKKVRAHKIAPKVNFARASACCSTRFVSARTAASKVYSDRGDTADFAKKERWWS